MITITTPEALDLARHTMILIIQVSAPLLIVGMAVGLTVSLVQAVTQLQEQTVTFVPKMVAVAVAGIIFLPWMSTRIMEFSATMFTLK